MGPREGRKPFAECAIDPPRGIRTSTTSTPALRSSPPSCIVPRTDSAALDVPGVSQDGLLRPRPAIRLWSLKVGRDPLVTIGLPVLNGAPLVARALLSILEQDYSNLEIIVSDNCSSDATPDIVSSFQKQDNRVQLDRLNARVSLIENWNRLAKMATGDYFRWSAHDDWVAPSFVSRCVERLEADRNAGLAFTNTVLVDPEGAIVGGVSENPRRIDSLNPIDRVRATIWRVKAFPAVVHGLSRTECLQQTGGLPRVIPQGRLWLAEMALLGPILHIAEPLFFRQVDVVQYVRDSWTYQHPENAARTLRTHVHTLRSFLDVFHKYDLSALTTTRLMTELGARLVQKALGEVRLGVSRNTSDSDLRALLPTDERYPFHEDIEVSIYVARTAVASWTET